MKQGVSGFFIAAEGSNLGLSRAAIVHWVSENLRPFSIVEDRGFQVLMKTGRPEYYIPSRHTVARDVHMVFAHTRSQIAKMLQVSVNIDHNKQLIKYNIPEV